MRVYSGKCLVEGAAIAPIFVYRPPQWEDCQTVVADTQQECERYRSASEKAAKALQERYTKALQSNSEEQAAIFEAQQMMLEDEDFSEQIQTLITEDHRSAVSAVMETAESFAQIFLQMDSDIMKSKAADMRDIASLVIRFLQDRQLIFDSMPSQCIVLAERLLPGELAEMDSRKVLGIVLKESSAHSHLAVLAAGRKLPFLLCPDMDLQDYWTGQVAGMDSAQAKLWIDISLETAESLRRNYRFTEPFASTLPQKQDTQMATAEGFKLCLNIGHPKELTSEVIAACDGVGVFRSEFQFIGKSQEPDEESLFEDYRYAAEALKSKTLVIRTIDIGADKQAAFLHLPPEENPALGCRGIRLCFERKDLFIKQLRAILRASAYGKIALLLPMICQVDELLRSKAILEEVKKSLRGEDIPFDENIALGVMIETPAAVLIADELAREADFFSVGSNDLTQYCLAVDRDNRQMESYYDAQHPAVMKLLKMTAQAASDASIGLCICGELARVSSATQILVDMGYRQFSVSPAFIPLMKETLALCKR
ncbi:MAG: phosphoenolpyruvate--protein phosphotransferase [Bacteroidales bacterium]|nr:phosphoenolpyruvate--protein phosphotransferase [Bacteroidales bacterium]